MGLLVVDQHARAIVADQQRMRRKHPLRLPEQPAAGWRQLQRRALQWSHVQRAVLPRHVADAEQAIEIGEGREAVWRRHIETVPRVEIGCGSIR